MKDRLDELADKYAKGFLFNQLLSDGKLSVMTKYCEELQFKNKELIEALTRISKYQSIEKLLEDSEKDWGLEYVEALEMAYENMQNEAIRLNLKTNKK